MFIFTGSKISALLTTLEIRIQLFQTKLQNKRKSSTEADLAIKVKKLKDDLEELQIKIKGAIINMEVPTYITLQDLEKAIETGELAHKDINVVFEGEYIVLRDNNKNLLFRQGKEIFVKIMLFKGE